jgi:hypothetical protein
MAQCHLNGWVRLFFVCLSSLALLSGCQPLGIVSDRLDFAGLSIGEVSMDDGDVAPVQTSALNDFTLSAARLNFGVDDDYADDNYRDEDYSDEDYSDDDYSDDDYGWSEDEEDKKFLEDFERSHMVHRRAIFDVRGGGFFPIDPDMEAGFALGFTAEIEVYKNLYFGIGFDYSSQDVAETASDVLNQFNDGDPAAEASAAKLDPEQWFEDMERYSLLFLFDYDFPIVENEDISLVFRGGVGLGVVVIEGNPVSNTFALDIEARTYANFQARPKVGLHLTFLENFTTFVEVAYDYIPEDALTIEGTFFKGKRTKLLGDVDFSGIAIFGGFGIIW